MVDIGTLFGKGPAVSGAALEQQNNLVSSQGQGVKGKRKLLQSAVQTRRPYIPAAIPVNNPYNEIVMPMQNNLMITNLNGSSSK